ncbi:choice-of-anchor U domain-containing protein [Marinobacterium stanieri]|uniref:choice-of-anchor U domain-containing protein n=1 Tax=Marinobacterium stanieri TaxID=49186 RepID=UPI0002559E7B|nr:cadherin-like domain-containing protein [Marinobacterium stanieri]
MADYTIAPGNIYESGDFEDLVGPSESSTYNWWRFNEEGTYTFSGTIDSTDGKDAIDWFPLTFGSNIYGISYYLKSFTLNLYDDVTNNSAEFSIIEFSYQEGDFFLEQPLADIARTEIYPTSDKHTITIGNGVVDLEYSLTLEIAARPENRAPQELHISDQAVRYSEGSNHVTVGTLLTEDLNAGDSHSYSLVSGTGSTHNDLFTISGNSLQAINPQGMAPGTYSVLIRTEDFGGLAYEKPFSITVTDDLPPSVQSITATEGAPGSIEYTVTFNEDVQAVSTDDFTLTGTGTATGSIAEVTGSGTVFTVTVNNLSGDGNLRLDLTGSNNITDASGNNAEAFNSGESIYFDTVPPVISSSNIAITGAGGTNGEFIVGDTITATWDNSASGDNNGDVASVTMDFSDFGGNSAVTASNTGGFWSATFEVLEGILDATDLNLTVNATDNSDNLGSGSSTDVSLDNELPHPPSANALLEVFENAGTNTVLGSVSASDDDGYSFNLSDDAGGQFNINSTTGEITYAGGGLDHENSPAISITATTTDNAGNTASQTLNIDVLDVNDAPAFLPIAATGDYTENGTDADLWTANGIDTIETGQSLLMVKLLVGGVIDGTDEHLVADVLSGPIELVTGTQSLTLNSQPLDVTIVDSDYDLEITLEASTLALTDWQGLVESLAYRHISDAPTAGPREISIVSVQDDGGTLNNGRDMTSGTKGTRTFEVHIINDSPVISVNSGPNILVGRSITLDSSHLNADDPDDASDQLTYTLDSIPARGTLALDGTTLDIGDTFTQQDIKDGLITFTAGNLSGEAAFELTLADGGEDGATSVSTTFSLNVRVPPPPPPPTPEPEPTLPDINDWENLPDPDADGVPDEVEDQVISPTGVSGDGNGDGIADSAQKDVASLPFFPHGQEGEDNHVFITLTGGSLNGKSIGSGVELLNVHQQDRPEDAPDSMDMPLGMIAFEALLGDDRIGSTQTFSLYVDDTTAVNGFWKQDDEGNWVNLASADYGGQVVLEGNRIRLDFQLTDNGEFDADNSANGRILDPGALAFNTSTLSEQVQALYIAYYQRPADSAGLDFWVDYLSEQNGSLEQVVDAFSNSNESRTLYGELNDTNISQFLIDLYGTLFNRAIDSEGLAFYRNAFITSEYEDGRPATVGNLMLDILQGAQNGDAELIDTKLDAARTFTWLLDPDQDGEVTATYDANDLSTVRDWLQGVTDNDSAPGVSGIHSLIRNEVAEAGDPITLVGDNGVSELLF